MSSTRPGSFPRAALGAILALAMMGAFGALASADGGGPVTLQDVFEADGILDHVLHATLEDLDVRGPAPEIQGGVTFVQKTINGIRYFGYPEGTDPTDPANFTEKRSRVTVELWFPNQVDFGDLDTSWLLLNQGGDPNDTESESLRLKRIFSRKMARQGIPAAIWFESDLHPVVPGNPVGTIAEQFGYNADGRLLHEGLTWMMLKDPDVTPLEIRDLRFHFRFGMAQAYMLATTFCQRFLEEHYGPSSSTWAAALKSIIAGGSKRGTACVSVCGLDPRVRGARISGSQSLNSDALGTYARYRKDWGECPGGRLEERADFVFWSEEHGDDAPSYYDIYLPDRCPESYQNILFADIVGTHDFANPLGAHATFWPRFDGLDENGLPDPTEMAIDHVRLYRENKNHGSESFIGEVNGFQISKSLVLLWRLVRHLALGKDLPRIELIDLDASGSATWTARVRITGAHDPGDEQLTFWVALSDDRDFRRCTPPVETLPFNPCYEGDGDDNREEEDKFIAITPTQVTQDGLFRDLVIPVPTEYAAFSNTPILCTHVELVLEGNNPNRFGDDLWMATGLVYRNDELYPELTCP